MNLNEITLATLPNHLRQLCIWLLLVLAFGYFNGLMYVYTTTGVTPQGAEERYRGNQAMQQEQLEGAAPVEMKFEKSPAEMLNIVHTHVIGMGTMFALSSIIFAFSTTFSGFWKKFLLLEPFVAIITSFVSMWLMWKVHPSFSWALTISSGSMALVFYVTVGVSLWELMRKRS